MKSRKRRHSTSFFRDSPMWSGGSLPRAALSTQFLIRIAIGGNSRQEALRNPRGKALRSLNPAREHSYRLPAIQTRHTYLYSLASKPQTNTLSPYQPPHVSDRMVRFSGLPATAKRSRYKETLDARILRSRFPRLRFPSLRRRKTRAPDGAAIRRRADPSHHRTIQSRGKISGRNSSRKWPTSASSAPA